MSTSHPTPARQLVEAFGDLEAMAALYTDDIVWRLSHSLPPNITGPHVGIEAVTGFNRAVFEIFYDPASVVIDILDEIGDDALSVVRFDMHAQTSRGHSYAVEYALFAKTTDGLIHEVVELLDTQASTAQHQGQPVGVPPQA